MTALVARALRSIVVETLTTVFVRGPRWWAALRRRRAEFVPDHVRRRFQ